MKQIKQQNQSSSLEKKRKKRVRGRPEGKYTDLVP